VKENDDGGWSSNIMVLWLGRGKIETRLSGEVSVKIEMTFYSSRGWESSCPERLTCGGGANSILYFQLERGDDRTKHCRKMK
jgi:hypothetical protein